MTQDWITYLVGQIQDLLDAGPVGLYEFRQELRGAKSGPAPDSWPAICNAALEILLAEPDIHLIRTVWARDDLTVAADGTVPTATDWQTPGDGPYLALDTV